jgi:hypothetical protein
MPTYRQYPPPELQEAMDWIKGRYHGASDPDEVRGHYWVLLNHLQELIITYHNYVALCRYRASTEARNVLAKQLYVALQQGRQLDYVRGDKVEHEIRSCLELADTFLEKSGEKKVVVEEVERALREVLGWER